MTLTLSLSRITGRGDRKELHQASILMAKGDTKSDPRLDVLVLGEHPATYLTAALLAHKTKLRVLHATIPGEEPVDRLVTINPAFFDLHPLLGPLLKKLHLTSTYGLRFLADDPETRSDYP